MKAAIPGAFPNFAQPVPKNGYAWWYIDAVSDDGRRALTLIAFIGSVFSPYYAWARGRGDTEPLEHCALNVALYAQKHGSGGGGGDGANRWAMTERGRAAVFRSERELRIGPSSLDWDGECLRVEINEIATPLPSRIRGTVRIRPAALTNQTFKLDGEGLHRWHPIAPCSRIEVDLSHPRLRWSGNAYWDTNTGARPLEQDFASWNWSRSSGGDGVAILYEGIRRGGAPFCLALRVKPEGGVERFEPPEPVQLASTRWWRVPRRTRAEHGQAEVVKTLEDTPFYSRSLLRSRLLGQSVEQVHESLSLERFERGWVRMLLPFRMPRRG